MADVYHRAVGCLALQQLDARGAVEHHRLRLAADAANGHRLAHRVGRQHQAAGLRHIDAHLGAQRYNRHLVEREAHAVDGQAVVVEIDGVALVEHKRLGAVDLHPHALGLQRSRPQHQQQGGDGN